MLSVSGRLSDGSSASLGLNSMIVALLGVVPTLTSLSRGADRYSPSRLSQTPCKVGGEKKSPGLSDTQKTSGQRRDQDPGLADAPCPPEWGTQPEEAQGFGDTKECFRIEPLKDTAEQL